MATCFLNNVKSKEASGVYGLVTYEYKFNANNLQLSYGHKGISPHGFVDTVVKPRSAYVSGIDSLITVSQNKIPGSADFHALCTIFSHRAFALMVFVYFGLSESIGNF